MTIYDASTQALGNDNPTVAFNLTTTGSHSTQLPFLDLMKSSRDWLGHAHKDWGAMSTAKLREGGYLDENGWVKEIPDGMVEVGTIWNWSDSYGIGDELDVFVLTYEGEGNIDVDGNGVKILSQEDGKIVFSYAGGPLGPNITETDPNGTGNYIRNVSVVHQDNVELHEAGALFNPEWLEIVADSRQFRFMGWTNTNRPTIETWEEYPTIDSANWNTVPVEVMVRLANEAGVDPWFNMPHIVDDNFIREFAEYVRDNLDPNLTVRVEWSNEVWNNAFAASKWAHAQGEAEWGKTGYDVLLNYQAKRATEVALIWEEVFAQSDTSPELVNVMGSRPGGEFSNEQVLTAPLWEANDPDGYVAPHTVFDELSVTTYFGQYTVTNEDQRLELIEKIQDPSIDATAWLGEKLLDPEYSGSLPRIIPGLLESKAIADKYGVALTAYEGGQHVHHSFAVRGLTKEQQEILNDFLADFVRSPEMAVLYEQLYDIWAEISDSPFMQFGDVGISNKYGSWTLLTHLADTNPRAEFLLDKLHNDRAWWDDTGNEAYLQGKYERGTDGNDQIIGTDAEDFLSGGAGDDEFYAAKGRDGVNGGAGTDRLFLAGNRSEYTITADGDGHIVSGPDGEKFVINIENFVFRDGEIVSLADFLSGNPGTTTDIPEEETDTTDQTDTGDSSDGGEGSQTDNGSGSGDGSQTDNGSSTGDGDGSQTDGGGATTDPNEDQSSNNQNQDETQDANANPTPTTPQDGSNSNTNPPSTEDTAENETNLWRASEAFDALSKGIAIVAINSHSQLGKELSLNVKDGPSSGYIAYEHGSTASYTADNGENVTVGTNYYALNANTDGKNGAQISDTAIETANQFGEIILAPDAIHATELNDRFIGRRADDVVYGEAGNDLLVGKRGNDTLDGGADNDRLVGGKGNDEITGGSGNDRFYFSAGDGQDVITDFEHNDSLELAGYFANGDALSSEHTSQDNDGNAVISNGADSITLLGLSETELDGWLSIA
ncbi:calcium-binding protein [Roseovarius sp. EL26]|uniref:calcium-binding protein n=1 Tax=Roseovarius sp. EL26 TaxID=2126672 RepID=UPI000EA10C63|nr:calcium-binding protein [Roseovarius sp. EL26]